MRKNFKRNLIAVAGLACMATFALGVGTNAAKAETLVETGKFYMSDGASIRVVSGTPSGIRWAVNVSQVYYNQITDNGTKTVQFGTLVDDSEIVNIETNTSEVDIPCTATPNFVDGVWTYYASITYDKLAETLAGEGYNYTETQIAETLVKVYDEVLYARGYAVVDGVYTYAEEADVARSIKGVAINCLIQENTIGNADVTEDNKSTFVAYAGGTYDAIENDGVTKNAYDLTKATGTVVSQKELAAGEYTVYVGAKKIGKVAHDGGKISTTIAGLGSTIAVKGEENNVRFINASGEVYQVPFVSATHAISTTAELNAFLNSYNNKTDGTNPSDNYYAVLTNDIDYEKKTALPTGTNNSYIFRGTFNGMGYAIKNYIVSGSSQKGVFGAIHGNALIENVAFIGAQGNGGDSPLVLGQIYGGTVRNIYVQGCYASHVTTGFRGAFYAGGLGVASNCIVDIDYLAGSTKTTNVFTGEGGGSLNTNTMFGIGNATRLEPQTATAPYANGEKFLAEKASAITIENGWNEYWSVGSYGLFFGDEHIINALKTQIVAQYTFANNAYVANETFNVDLTKVLDGKTAQSVAVNGNAVAPVGNTLTLNCRDYTLGETYTVAVSVDGKMFAQPFMYVSHAISTTAELNEFLNSYNNKTDGTNPSDNYYAVLTNDIDYEKTVLPTGTNNRYIFRGTFNGMGYAIKNYIVSGSSQKGVFGAIHGNALIENVAFIGAQGNGGDSPLVLGYTYGGTVRNIYVQGCYASHVTTGFRGAFYAGGLGVASNCIVDIDYLAGSTKTTNVFTGEGGGSLNTNTMFGIGNATRLEPQTATTPYATVAAMLAQKATTITSANGWSEYWSFDANGNLYFGDEKVAD